MKKVIYIFLLLSESILAQQPDAVNIMEKSRDLTITEALRANISLTIIEKNGSERNRTVSITSKSYPDGTEKRLIKFLEPADVKGTGMLIIDNKNIADEMWIYLPALKRTRRIATTEKGKSFMNSEFTNADMSSPALSDFRIKHLEGSGQGGYWIIESIPVDAEKVAEYGFSRRVSYIDMKNFQVKKMEMYDRSNKLNRIIEVISIYPGKNGKYIINEMKAKNLSNGRSSTIKFTNISLNEIIADELFTVQNLEK